MDDSCHRERAAPSPLAQLDVAWSHWGARIADKEREHPPVYPSELWPLWGKQLHRSWGKKKSKDTDTERQARHLDRSRKQEPERTTGLRSMQFR